MTEAVIVATARSPIGRAVKGSLVDLRPDDMSAQIVQALMAKVSPDVPMGLLPCTYHVHPSQLYACVTVFAIGIFLSWAYYKKWRTGTVSVLFLLTYPVARFILRLPLRPSLSLGSAPAYAEVREASL